MKVTQVIKYLLIVADLVGMAGLFYAGINTFINFTNCTNGASASSTYTLSCPNANCTLVPGNQSLTGTDGKNTITINANCVNESCTGNIYVNGPSGYFVYAVSVSCGNQTCTATASGNICVSSTQRSVQDIVWGIYYMIFAVVITLSLFQLPFVKKGFNFLYSSIGRGIFISFWGTLLLAKTVNFVLGIGIYLIILGAVHVIYGFCTVNHCLSPCIKLYFVQWNKKPEPSSQDKYETGMNQPAGQQNNAAASDNAQRAQQESVKKKKAKETTNNEQQEPPQDNQAADNNINLSARKKGAKTKKGYQLDEEEA